MNKRKAILVLTCFVMCAAANFVAAQRKPGGAAAASAPQSVWKWRYLSKQTISLIGVAGDLAITSAYTQTDAANKPSEPIIAIDAQTGKVRWQIQNFGTAGKFAFDEKNVYLEKNYESLIALDRATGAERWRFEPREIIGAVINEIKTRNKTVLVLGEEFGLIALDAETGKRQWNFRPCFDFDGGSYDNSPRHKIVLSRENLALACANGDVYQVSAATGAQLSKLSFRNTEIKEILADDRHFYFLGGLFGGNGFVEAVSGQTFERAWFKSFSANNLYDAEMHLHNENIVLQSKFGSFTAISASDGRVLWEIEKGENDVTVKSPDGYDLLVSGKTKNLVFAQNTIFGASEDGFVRAVNQADGTIKWQKKLADSINLGLVIQGDTILADDGERLSALDAANGKLRWQIRGASLAQFDVDRANNLYFVAYERLLGKTDVNQLEKFAGSSGKTIARLTNPFGGAQKGRDIIPRISMSGNGSSTRPTYSDLVFANGKAYFTETVAANKQGALVEINLADARQKKVAQMSATALTAPTIIGNTAIVGASASVYTEDTRYGAKRYVADARTPAQIFAIDLSGSKILWSAAASAAVLTETVGDREKVVFASADGMIRAVDKSGALVWEHFDGLPEYVTVYTEAARLAFDNNVVYATTPTRKTIALDAANGKVLWSVLADEELFIPTISEELTAPTIKNDCVLIGESFSLKCFDKQTGELRRETKLNSNIKKIETLPGGIAVESYETFTVLDDNAAIRWSRQLRPESVFAGKNELLFFYDNAALDLTSGVKTRRLLASEDFRDARPVHLNGDTVYFDNYDGITAANLKTGKILWKIAR